MFTPLSSTVRVQNSAREARRLVDRLLPYGEITLAPGEVIAIPRDTYRRVCFRMPWLVKVKTEEAAPSVTALEAEAEIEVTIEESASKPRRHKRKWKRS